MEKLFRGKERYITKGIKQRLTSKLQMFLWNCILEKEKCEDDMDYLQVFRLQNFYEPGKSENIKTKIVHSQEVLEYASTYVYRDGSSLVEGTIFVIDDGNVVTMLWAKEY